jgi:DNA adenine methylase
MILNRLGKKAKLAPKILRYFPPHKAYAEPFFGAGGMYFNKSPRAKYNFLNDIDDDVYNLFRQVVDNREELFEWVNRVPITETQFFEWGDGKKEELPVLQAVRFLVLSNFGLYGKPSTLRHGMVDPRSMILKNIDPTFELLRGCQFLNTDFRTFFNRLDFRGESGEVNDFFCYCDPPYLETDDNYSHSFTEQDSADLFQALEEAGLRWAMSEFDHPFILDQAKERNLFVHYLGERTNLLNKRIEILVTNYMVPQLKLF